MKKYIYLSLSILFVTGFNSCLKKGCTDPIATNYNYLAKKDDANCVYGENGLGKLGPKKLDCNIYMNSWDTIRLTNDPNRDIDYLIDCGNSLIVDYFTIIEPGVVIQFGDNSSLFFTSGVSAIGTPTQKIIFTAANQSDWNGISLSSNYYTVFDYTEITKVGPYANASLSIYDYGFVNFTNSIIREGMSTCGIFNDNNNSSLNTTGTTFTNVTSDICYF